MPRSDEDSGHADLIILLTGQSSGGLAMMGSTCGTDFGRAVNNDIGLASAIIIAHEAAHTFGLGHDGNGEQCNNSEYIMASVVSDGKNAFKWSPCSRNRIQEFLTGFGSSCLDDNPHNFIHEPSIFHNKLPGQIANATLQCILQYGQGISSVHKKELTVALCTVPAMVIYARATERHLWMAHDVATDIGASKVNV